MEKGWSGDEKRVDTGTQSSLINVMLCVSKCLQFR